MKKVVFVSICLLGILSASWANAESKTINIVTILYPPFMNGDRSGLAEKLHIASFRERGYEVVFEYYPQKRAYKVFRKKDNSLFNGADEFATSDIAQDVEFFGVAYIQIIALYIKDHFPELKPKEPLENLKNKIIGCQRGAFITLRLYEKAGLIIDFADAPELNIKKLKAKRIDFLSTIDLSAKKLIHDYFNGHESEFGMLEVHRIQGGLTVKKGSIANEAFQEYKKGFKAIKEKGIYLKILEEFYGPGQVPDSVLVF